MPEEFAGVEDAPVAGEQQAQAQEEEQSSLDFSYLEDDQSGVEEEPAVAGQEDEGGEEPRGQSFEDERVEKAFAKRLAQEKEKIKRELEEELRQQLQQQQQQQPQLSFEERVQQLADELMITPEAARLVLEQQEQLRRLETQTYLMRDESEKVRVESLVNEKRKTNPYLPPFNEEEIFNIRMQHYNRYGIMPTWEDAYNYYVAEKLKSGEFGRVAEQQAIQKITSRNRANVQVGKSSRPEKRNLWELSDEEFERLKEEAKTGKLTKF